MNSITAYIEKNFKESNKLSLYDRVPLIFYFSKNIYGISVTRFAFKKAVNVDTTFSMDTDDTLSVMLFRFSFHFHC